MSGCPHYWTVTSECPMCLRAEADKLRALLEAIIKAPDGIAVINAVAAARGALRGSQR